MNHRDGSTAVQIFDSNVVNYSDTHVSIGKHKIGAQYLIQSEKYSERPSLPIEFAYSRESANPLAITRGYP